MRKEHVALASLVLLSLVACKAKSKTLPTEWTGSFVRHEPALMGLGTKTSSLEIAPTGMTARASGMGLEMTGGFDGAEGKITDSQTVSVLFQSVSCEGATCSFTGAGRCEGTVFKDADGDVTVVATGACAGLSGKWLGPRSASRAPGPSIPSFH